MVGYSIGGVDGAICGALLGASLGAGVAGVGLGRVILWGWDAAKVSYWLGGIYLAYRTLYSGYDDWGFAKTNSPKKVAVVMGDLGWKAEWQMAIENTSVLGFGADAGSAGHEVSFHHNPDEAGLAALMNDNDVVVIVAHGLGDPWAIMGNYYDRAGTPVAGVRLGGTGLHANENPVHEAFRGSPDTTVPNVAWVTANELQGNVSNSDLILAVAGCRVGKTNRFSQAIGIDPVQGGHFASYTGDLNPAGIENVLYYVRDYLNSGQATAAANFAALNRKYVLDPTNTDF